MAERKLHRREFLTNMSRLGVALPFLPCLADAAFGAAAPYQAPKRFISIFTANGQYGPDWYPQAPSAGATSQALADMPGPVSNIFGSEYNALKGKISLLRGLDHTQLARRGHTLYTMLSGTATDLPAITIDQIMARSPKIYSSEPVARSLDLKVSGYSGCSVVLEPETLSCAEVGGTLTKVSPILRPSDAYLRLFAPSLVSNRGLPEVLKRFQLIKQHPYLSKDDRDRLDAHFTLLDDLNKSLAPDRSKCSASPEAASDDTNFERYAERHIDLLVAAIKCGLTQVANLTLNESGERRGYNFLPGVTAPFFHEMSHDSTQDTYAQLALINQCHAKLVARLLTALDVVEDPSTGRTFLDNSVVYWGNESGVKLTATTYVHLGIDLPTLVAGGGGGSLKSGQFIDYRTATTGYWNGGQFGDDVAKIGRPMNELLITLMMAMGLSKDDWEIGGQAGFGDYNDNYEDQYKVGDKRSPLKGLLVS